MTQNQSNQTTPQQRTIPVCEPTLNGNELKYVTDAIQTGWISSAGKYITQFEEKFAQYCNVKYGVSCANGTLAIHLALAVMNIGEGDEVILPSFTMIGSCNPIVQLGATPVFVDSELETWNIDPAQIESKITPKTKAIMVVHTYGHPVDMDPILTVAHKHHIPVIEDAAEGHGAEYKGRKIGSLGDIACFSFYANKIITTGEGGMVVTNNEQWATKAKNLRNHFFGQPRFLHQETGYNFRLTNVQAAIGLAQVERIDQLVNARRHNAALYNQKIKAAGIRGLITPPQASWAKNVYWMYGLLVQESFGLSMPQLCAELSKRGVETRTFFIGMHKQPCYINYHGKNKPHCSGPYPHAEFLETHGFYLPSSSHLTESEIDHIVATIKAIQQEHQK